MVELRAVTFEVLEVEDGGEGLLDDGDVGANSHLAAEALLEVLSTSQVIGMDVSLQDPLNSKSVLLDEVDNLGRKPSETRNSESQTTRRGNDRGSRTRLDERLRRAPSRRSAIPNGKYNI